MNITKGHFKDGTVGWKAVKYEPTKQVGFATHEIHWSDDGECVAEVVHGEADAKLIAAAPELLQACNFALQGIKHGQIDELTEKILADAIAKAVG